MCGLSGGSCTKEQLVLLHQRRAVLSAKNLLRAPLFCEKLSTIGQTHPKRADTEREVVGFLTCERPGEGAGWGVEGGPVIGCGALFISRSSAWGGGCGPAYKSVEKENGSGG